MVRGAVRDALNADARRAAAPRTTTTNAATTTSSGTPSATPPAPAVDVTRMRALDRAIARTGHAPSEAAYQRMERAFADESPSDVDGWVRDYYAGLGVARTTAAPAASTAPSTTAHAPTTVATPANPPVSASAPTAPSVPLEQQNVLQMSQSDRDALRRQLGPAKYAERLMQDARGVTIRRG